MPGPRTIAYPELPNTNKLLSQCLKEVVPMDRALRHPETAAEEIFDRFRQLYNSEVQRLTSESPDRILSSLPDRLAIFRPMAMVASRSYHTLPEVEQEAIVTVLKRIIDDDVNGNRNAWNYLEMVDSPELFTDILYRYHHGSHPHCSSLPQMLNRLALADLHNYGLKDDDVGKRFRYVREKVMHDNGRFRPGIAKSEFLATQIILNPHFTAAEYINDYLNFADKEFVARVVKAVVRLHALALGCSPAQAVQNAEIRLPESLHALAIKSAKELMHPKIEPSKSKSAEKLRDRLVKDGVLTEEEAELLETELEAEVARLESAQRISRRLRRTQSMIHPRRGPFDHHLMSDMRLRASASDVAISFVAGPAGAYVYDKLREFVERRKEKLLREKMEQAHEAAREHKSEHNSEA